MQKLTKIAVVALQLALLLDTIVLVKFSFSTVYFRTELEKLGTFIVEETQVQSGL